MQITLLLSILFVAAIGPVCAQQDSTMTQKPVQPATYVDQMPTFPGGVEVMYTFIYTTLRYPAEAKRLNITGQVITRFTVNSEGKLEDIKMVRGLGYGCDEEAIRVVTEMQKKYTWNPGIHNGHAVPVVFTLPLRFHVQ